MGWSGPVTHRQYLAWQAWDREEWNKPSRTDYYLMQLTLAIYRVNSKTPGSVRMKDCELKFTQTQKPSAVSAAKWSKSVWFGALGLTQPTEG